MSTQRNKIYKLGFKDFSNNTIIITSSEPMHMYSQKDLRELILDSTGTAVKGVVLVDATGE